MQASEAAASAVKACTEATVNLEGTLKQAKKTFAKHPHTLIGQMIRYTLVNTSKNAKPTKKRRKRTTKTNNSAVSKAKSSTPRNALVVGCRIEDDATWYKVFIIDGERYDEKDRDSSTQVISLAPEYTSHWTLLVPSQNCWPDSHYQDVKQDDCIVPLGQRLIVCWKGNYTSKENKQLQKSLKAQKIPYEAFVVRNSKKESKILYTADEQYQWKDMAEDDEDCTYILPYATHFNSLPLVTWSNFATGGSGGAEKAAEEEEMVDKSENTEE